MSVSPAHPELLAACGDDGTTIVVRNVRDVSAASGDERKQRACRAQVASPALLSFDAEAQTIIVHAGVPTVPRPGGSVRHGFRESMPTRSDPAGKRSDSLHAAMLKNLAGSAGSRGAAALSGGGAAAAAAAVAAAPRELAAILGLRRIALGPSDENWRLVAFGGASGLLHVARIGADGL